MSLSVDGRLALSGSEDGALRLWEMSTGRCLRTFHGHTFWVTSVSLSADGRLALSGSQDQTLRLWEIPRRDFFCPLYPSRARSLAEMSHLEMQANTLLEQAEQAHKDARFTLALTLLQELRALPGWERASKSLQAWSRLTSSCSRVGLRTSWQANTFHGHTWGVNSVSLSVDGRLALSGSVDHTLRLWEVSTGDCLRVFEGHTDGVTSVSLSVDGCLALSGSKDRALRLWEVRTGRCLRVFEGHTDGVTSVSLSADGRFALSGCGRLLDPQGSRDQTLRLWEVSTGRCLHIFEGHTGGATLVSLSADGRLALSSDHKNSTLQLWELGTGRCLRVLEGHTGWVQSANLSADGHFALSGSRDHTMRLWEVRTGHCLRVFEGHTSYVDAVSFSADGRFILSGSLDHTMRLWEVRTGHCLRVFEGHTSSVTSVSFSADGRFALSGSMDRTLRLWEFEWELEAHDLVDWNEGAPPVLEIFLTLHTPPIATLPPDHNPSEQEAQQFLTRCGMPTWSEQDFQELIRQLQYAGYGWLRPEGVRRKLEEKTQALQRSFLVQILTAYVARRKLEERTQSQQSPPPSLE